MALCGVKAAEGLTKDMQEIENLSLARRGCSRTRAVHWGLGRGWK